MKKVVFYVLQLLHIFVYLLVLGSVFNINLSYFREYRMEASNLETAIEQIYPSAEIINEWDLNGSKLYVFQDGLDFRYIFFPKAVFSHHYALNSRSILSTYIPFQRAETIEIQLQDFRCTYHANLSLQELTITEVDKTKNLTGFSPIWQCIIILVFISIYVVGAVLRGRRFKARTENSKNDTGIRNINQ